MYKKLTGGCDGCVNNHQFLASCYAEPRCAIWFCIVRPMLSTPITVRWGDMDSYGHVNNVFFIRYLEDTRFALFTPEIFGLFPDGANGLMAGHRIEYQAPLSYSDGPITSWLWITRIGNSSFEIGYRLVSGDGATVYAIASTTLVLVDAASGRPVALPDPLRAALTEHLGEPVPFRG
jgi:acyl-CoA thioester hydrolase